MTPVSRRPLNNQIPDPAQPRSLSGPGRPASSFFAQHMHRRSFLSRFSIGAIGSCLLPRLASAADRVASAAPSAPPAPVPSLIAATDRAVLWNGRRSGKSWFHPRPCLVPSTGDNPPLVFMTLQEITGSDNYGQVHWTTSEDLGKTWLDPEPVPAFARATIGDQLEEGVCDVVPQYHPLSGRVLAMGHNVYYRQNRLAKPQEDRFPVYALWTPNGGWSERHRLDWKDPRGSGIYTCGCGERLLTPDGQVLVAISFVKRGGTNREVTTFRCALNGKTLKVQELGTVSSNPVKRGLLEPSLARWRGEYFMTLRAEDDRGYVSRSADGLAWAKPTAWTFDDGEPLVMSTTQQHWLAHSDALHLVYTRRTPANVKVSRWRAPLFIAAVDPLSLALIRRTERVVFPMEEIDPTHVARTGNFHTLTVSAAESWVTTGEERSADGWKGDVLLARIRWSRPNLLA